MYHKVLEASPGSANLNKICYSTFRTKRTGKIGERRQMLTDRNNVLRENKTQQDFDNEVGMKVLIDHESLRKAESPYKRTMDYYQGLYEGNYQGSTRSKIGKNKNSGESKTIPQKLRGIGIK
jgi:hypothetical protein